MWRSVAKDEEKAEVTEDCRLASVTPIYEKGWKEGLENYRLR